jgi:hypothetical protein
LDNWTATYNSKSGIRSMGERIRELNKNRLAAGRIKDIAVSTAVQEIGTRLRSDGNTHLDQEALRKIASGYYDSYEQSIVEKKKLDDEWVKVSGKQANRQIIIGGIKGFFGGLIIQTLVKSSPGFMHQMLDGSDEGLYKGIINLLGTGAGVYWVSRMAFNYNLSIPKFKRPTK